MATEFLYVSAFKDSVLNFLWSTLVISQISIDKIADYVSNEIEKQTASKFRCFQHPDQCQRKKLEGQGNPKTCPKANP